MWFARGPAAALTALCAFVILGTASAGAAYDVTRFDDPDPGPCLAGDCSLREAVVAANLQVGTETIRLPPGAYNLTITGTDDAYEGDLDISDALSIRNAGPQPATIHAPPGNRVLRIAQHDTTLENVSLADGVAPLVGSARQGGGVRVANGASLEMVGGRVEANQAVVAGGDPVATVAFGAGIYNDGTVKLERVVVTGNTLSGGFGGGVFVAQSDYLGVKDSVISENTANGGGGIAGPGTVLVQGSRLRHNQAEDGGGVYTTVLSGGLFSTTGDYTVVGTNINGNAATNGVGGGLRVRDAHVVIRNSTVTQNTAALDGGGIAAKTDAPNATSVLLGGSIVAGNVDGSGPDARPDCVDETDPIAGGLVTSGGHNIVGNMTGCALHSVTGDHIGNSVTAVDAKLAGPAFNGGLLAQHLTQAPRPGSLALDGGPPAGQCGAIDSRGLDRDLGGPCDIGAYELVKCKGATVNRIGTEGEDRASLPLLAPTQGADGYLGFAGIDALKGGGGNDGICGGDGNDKLAGDAGKDKLAGGKGNDRLKGGAGRDKLTGGPGKDKLVGGPGRDVCIGGPGKDKAKSCEVKRSIP